MPEIQITARYYPTLSTVISTEELPDLLGFLKEGLAGLLDSIYYKDHNRLDLEIPGTGIFLSLNPDASDTVISSFPITVEYEWPILVYVISIYNQIPIFENTFKAVIPIANQPSEYN